MTKRVILTNKETGQVLPEATLLGETPAPFEVQFDGTELPNCFDIAEWTATYPRTFREADVLRRKDRDPKYGGLIFNEGHWWFGDSPSGHHDDTAKILLDNPEWEVV